MLSAEGTSCVLQIQDAQAAMRLYVSVRKEWESHARERGARGYTPGKCSNDT